MTAKGERRQYCCCSMFAILQPASPMPLSPAMYVSYKQPHAKALIINLKVSKVPAVYPAGPLPMMIVSRTLFCFSAVESAAEGVDMGAPVLPRASEVLRLGRDDVLTNGG